MHQLYLIMKIIIILHLIFIQYIDLINAWMIYQGYGIVYIRLFYFLFQGFPLFLIQFFRIINSIYGQIHRPDHRSCKYRSGKAASTGFITPGFNDIYIVKICIKKALLLFKSISALFLF